jgi:HTH-type transcriptional regulator/antitoxin HigA
MLMRGCPPDARTDTAAREPFPSPSPDLPPRRSSGVTKNPCSGWIHYPYRVVYIRFVGTRGQYDAIDPQTIWGDDMTIKPIRNEDDYRETLNQIETLMNARENTFEGDQLDVLVTLAEAHERKMYPMDLPDPVEAIKFYMEQNDMTPKELEPVIGRINRVYEVLNHTRPLTLKMIRNLHGRFGIPAESLIKEPPKRHSA